MPSPANITNIPAPRVELIDPKTGLLAREWYRFFLNLFQLTGGGTNETSLADLQVGPPVYDVTGVFSETIDESKLTGAVTGVEEQVSEIQKELQGLESFPSLQDLTEIVKRIEALEKEPNAFFDDEILKRIQALEAAPIPQSHIKKAAYGSFYDTTTQTAAAINTAYAMTFNTTDLSFGVTIGSPTSRIYVDTASLYNIQFSAQLDNTSGGNHLAFIWLRINGVDVANSAAQIRLKGTDGEVVAAWNYIQMLKANDYFELMWSVSDTSVDIRAIGAVAPVPAIPSVILTVTDNILAQVDNG